MSFSATLHIEGHPKEQDGITVISCDFSFNQQVDQSGVPVSKVSGGLINIGLRNENDYDIMMWMIGSRDKKNGKIVLSSGMADNQAFQKIEFKDALLVNYQQSFAEESEVVINLTLSCRHMEISGATFVNVWGGD